MRVLAAIIMILGLVAGMIAWNNFDSAAESAIHQLYAVAIALFWIIGAYVLGRALTLFSTEKTEESEAKSGDSDGWS